MYLPLINHSKNTDRGAVVPLPLSDSERNARLAIRIAESVSGMGLDVFEINACVRIGLCCMDQGSTLLGAHDHAVKVARRIILIKAYAQRAVMRPSEAGHGG